MTATDAFGTHAPEHPTFTNAHAQMCAVITAVTDRWGSDGEALIRATYRALGHRTGRQMIDTGIVPAGADLETYGRVSEQIMDTCGLEGWTRLTTAAPEHRTVVPGCAAYLPLFEFLDAPDNICELPFEWDNGCLDTINDGLEIWPRRCAYRGEADCHYVIAARDDATTPAAAPVADEPGAVAVRNEPTWTNPTAGFLALVGAATSRFGDAALDILRPALRALGARAGEDELDTTSTAQDAAQRLVRRYAAAGFVQGTARTGSGDDVVVDLGTNPYGPVLDLFGSHATASELLRSYDDGWAHTARDLQITVVSDSWTLGGRHVLSVRGKR
jgi:hypothetical protein